MAKTPEAKVKDKVKDILKENGIWYCMPIGTGYGNAGVPDFICCANGKFLAIETKTRGKSPTALQKRESDRIYDAGGIALVINEDNFGLLHGAIKILKGDQ